MLASVRLADGGGRAQARFGRRPFRDERGLCAAGRDQGASARRRLLRRRLARHLHARDDEGAAPARQGVGAPRPRRGRRRLPAERARLPRPAPRADRTSTRRRCGHASSWTSSPARRPGGSTASISPRRSRTTAPRTRFATSGWTRATSARSCAAGSRIPWWARAPWLLARARRKAPLHGDSMSVWLYDALEDMDKERTPAEVLSLMPPGHLLQLYVTTTDFYGYNRSVTLAGPETEPAEEAPSVFDWRHRHVLEFRHGDGRDDFKAPEDNTALAFSARATSSFPGRVPACQLPGLPGLPGRAEGPLPRGLRRKVLPRITASRRRRPKAPSSSTVASSTTDRSGTRSPRSRRSRPTAEVDRRLLYLEPDPGSPAKTPEQRQRAGDDRERARRALGNPPQGADPRRPAERSR